MPTSVYGSIQTPMELKNTAEPLLEAGDHSEDASEDSWKVGFAEPTPLPPTLWGWSMNLLLLGIQSWMVSYYASESKDLLWIEGQPVWVTYVCIQLVAMAYSWVACNYLFPAFPTVCGIPFFLPGFLPAFLIVAFPFVCTDVGSEMARNTPLSVLTAWSAVRLMFESTVQFHANYGVKGISHWLLWPIQKAPQPYTLTYPVIGAVTRTHGGNIDAASSLCIGLPTALILAIVDDDSSTNMIRLAWFAQLWMTIYLAVGPVFHFLGGMPGPANIFSFNGTPRECTGMQGLQRGTLGVCCYWIASYAVVHFIVFVRVFVPW